MSLTPKELSGYLQDVYNTASTLDKLKIVYRPYVCPFDILINDCNGSKTILDIGWLWVGAVSFVIIKIYECH
jgi:hypothetical protein